jgi:hypothetical protein
MPLSIWEYIRERTRNAVLAGMQDAMDIVEQGDTNGAQHQKAMEFSSRLTTEAKQLPAASMNGAEANGEAVAHPPTRSSPTTTEEAPQRPAVATSFDDELERRLDSAAPQKGRQKPSGGKETEPPVITKRGPGRPRKDGHR